MKVTRKLALMVAVLALLLPAVAAAQVYVQNNYLGVGESNPLFPLVVKEPGLPTFSFTSTTLAGTPTFNFKINGLGNFTISRQGDSPPGAALTVDSRGATNTVVIGGAIAATAFNTTSSRSMKENFTALDGAEVLARVVDLPVTRWNFKADANATPHLGPMAEDFHAAFGVGSGGDHIALNDLGGVALAAIQGLHAQVRERDQVIEQLLSRMAELERRLAE